MNLTALMLVLTVAWPLVMLLACAWLPVRERILAWLPLGALPGLVAALVAVRGEGWVFGNPRFPLAFAMDRTGGALLGVAALLWLAGGWYAATCQTTQPGRVRFAVCWLMTLTGCLGAFVVADMVSLYALLGLLSVGATGLIIHEASPGALRAGGVYIGLALLAESLLLAGFVLTVVSAPGNTLLIADAPAAIAASAWRDTILGLLIAGFGIKAGLVPFHFWMPLAYSAAPIPAAAVMSGAVVKVSVIGLIRFMPFEAAPWAMGAAVTAIGLFGALYGVLIGITQRNPKTVLAYSSVSQMGVIMAIVGMGMVTRNAEAGPIAAFSAVNHLLTKGALFMAVGVVAETGRRRLWTVLLPAGLLAVGLGGLPLSGGALAKSVAENLFGEGIAGMLATLSAIGTTVLMLHFLRCLKALAGDDSDERAESGLRWPWLLMAMASFVVPWALYLLSPRYSLPDALSPYALWSAMWPIVVGMALAWMLVSWKRRLPELPAGDILAGLAAVWRPLTQGASGAAACLDAAVRRWPLAGLVFLGLLLAFAVAMRA